MKTSKKLNAGTKQGEEARQALILRDQDHQFSGSATTERDTFAVPFVLPTLRER